MKNHHILHIWFDFSDTIGTTNRSVHNKLRYSTYANIVKRPVDEKLIQEYEQLYSKYQHSNSAVFHSLGKSSGFWSQQISSIDPSEMFELIDTSIPNTLDKLRKKVPISIFSNIELGKVLPGLSIQTTWFKHIISSGMVRRPKPANDGFIKIIELSKLQPQNILYVGDDVGKDVLPAKSVGLLTGLVWRSSEQADYSFRHFDDILEVA